MILPTTRVWGDTVGRFVGGSWEPPNHTVNADDLRAAVDFFLGLPDAPPLTWAEVYSELPDLCSSFGTMTQVIDAFSGYPYSVYQRGPVVCWCYTPDECDDGVYCNGAEVCTGDYYCVPGDDPCPGQLCDEASQSCVACVSDGDCDDGLYCTGQETCSEGACKDGPYPCGSDGCRESDDTCGPATGPLFSLIPVAAWSGDPILDGNEVTLTGGGHVVLLEVFVSGWDSDMDGSPGVLDSQAAVASRSLSNGSPGTIGYPQIPCFNTDDCEQAFGVVGPGCHYPGGDDLCTPAFQQTERPDFVNHNLAVADSHLPGARFLGSQFFDPGVTDDGTQRYMGTVALEVPEDAAGTYTIQLNPDGDHTFLNDADKARIPGLSTSPAVIIVNTDCNNNGQVDQDEIDAGTEADCNGNWLPDSCDISAGRSEDCTGNGTPDECEADCNGNSVADSCDVDAGTSNDCNFDEVPDECQPDEDCNLNSITDICDIGSGFSEDCQGNLVPDECDLASGTSEDVNGDNVPDECCGLSSAVIADVVVPDIGHGTQNLYLPFSAGDPGRMQAIRVRAISLPPPNDGLDCTTGICAERWVGPPYPISEASGTGGPTPEPTMTAARLQCDPFFMDWSTVGNVQVYGHGILPGGTYEIHVTQDGCDMAPATSYSAPLDVTTSAAGDVTGDCGVNPCTPPDGSSSFVDISAVVDKFKNLPGAPRKARADIVGQYAAGLPDYKIDFGDISCAVDAFRGSPCPVPTVEQCE